MKRRADTALDRMRDRLRDGPGELDDAVRRAALEGGEVPSAAAGLVDKIRRRAYAVTDEDVKGTQRETGWSDSQLFELVVATAVGEGLRRRAVIDRLLEGGS
ncbi:MAG TPA: hypothetical protein VHM89_00950 [Acidimicrobiales bacterium]|nr:hypothetical protein [Acidimicrobiales bacterium]